MKAFLLVWGLFQSFDFALGQSCRPRQGYMCRDIPTSFPVGMTSLVFWVDNIGEINSTVFNSTNLASVTALTLGKSGITAIAPGAFDKFQNLQIIDLQSNLIPLVSSSWFTHKMVLENFNLSRNRIATLNDDAFNGLAGLLTLNLSHNQIHSISAGAFHSLGNLRYLDLSNNTLSYLRVETLRPVNNTKLYLNGNRWNCSCTEFTDYLRELQRASLLENEMEVLCDSPACLRGVPVWNVSQCTESITDEPATVNSHILQSTPVRPQMSPSVLISLIVVLCALVLVICVLSVLYHRKRERKHLQTIGPSPEEPTCGKKAQSDCRGALESKNVVHAVPDLNKKPYYRTEVIQRLDQTVLESETMSQIYQIYGVGLFKSRDRNNRPKSAGPVLSRTDVFGRQLETEVENQKELKDVKDKIMFSEGVHEKVSYEEELLDGIMEAKREEQDCGNEDDKFQRMEKRHHLLFQSADVDEFSTTLEISSEHKEDQTMEGLVEKEKGALEENAKKQKYLHKDNAVFNKEEVKDNLITSLARHELSQPASDDAFQPVEDSETMPYLTIGTDAENQNRKLEQIPTEASTSQVPSRPIRRVLTWPPTAVQWKKQWAQNQQVLNVFPKFVFVTGCQNQNATFPFSTTSTSPEVIPQCQINFPSSISSARDGNILECNLSESKAVQEFPIVEPTAFKTVEPLKEICESAFHSYIQNLPNSAQDYAKLNKTQYGLMNHTALLNSQVHLDFHTGPVSEELHSEESVNSSKGSNNLKRGRRIKKNDRTSKSEQMASRSERQSRMGEVQGRKALGGQRDQCDSRVPPSGGSPSDDSLLVDNEYAFIDLLHEVVENHGRWTRDRWRQSHMNKQKHKQAGKSH